MIIESIISMDRTWRFFHEGHWGIRSAWVTKIYRDQYISCHASRSDTPDTLTRCRHGKTDSNTPKFLQSPSFPQIQIENLETIPKLVLNVHWQTFVMRFTIGYRLSITWPSHPWQETVRNRHVHKNALWSAVWLRVVTMVTLPIFTHLDYAHMCAFVYATPTYCLLPGVCVSVKPCRPNFPCSLFATAAAVFRLKNLP